MKLIEKYFYDKNILIIGAASGIGDVIVRQLSHYTCRLFLSARSQKKLEDHFGTESEFRYYEIDLQKIEEVKETLPNIKREAGRIDIVINLAGHDVFKDFISLSDSDIINTFSINLENTVLLIKHTIEILFENITGVLVNINGFVGGRLSMPFFSIDSASRSALANLFRSLRREYKETDIRFVLFSPSGLDTGAESHERGYVWEKNNIKLADPVKIVRTFLLRLSQGKDEITLASTGEKLLALLDSYLPAIADSLFYNTFFKKTAQLIKGKNDR